MIKKMMICAFIVLATSVGHSADLVSSTGSTSSPQASPPRTEQTNDAASASNRDDPFGGSFGDISSEPQPNVLITGDSIQSKPALFVRTVTLKFLSAVNLKTAMDKMSSAYGSISVNDSTNSIIICDTKDNLEKILVEIRKADQTPKQIMIEVVIIDVQLQNDTEIGVDWDILSTDNKDFSYRQSMIFPNRMSIVAPITATNDSMTAYQNVGLASGGEVALVTNDIRNVLHFLQEKRSVDILASPRVMVVSGQKASIKTIEEIPYQEVTQSSAGGGGSSAITSTQFKDVGITMDVKATVTDEGKILLTVSPSQSVTTGTSIGGVPVIDKREATTTLLMDDGQVVVMGGLRRQDTQIIKSQVPLLGDLPIIGFIFSNNHKVVQNSELLVLLSPHIHNGESVPAEAMTRFNQIRNRPVLSLPDDANSR
jgi:type II secretory pathway component GspD/PulD (secretin)